MNVLTTAIERTATNVALETQWPRQPISIKIDPAAPTAMSSSDSKWTDLPNSDLVYSYEADSSGIETADFITWIVHRAFTPPTESHFRSRILQANLPARWILEGAQPPTTECRIKSYKIWRHLYTTFGLLPVRVSASVEGGIMLSYEHATNGKTLIVEIYNDLEVAALVNESKKIIYSETINDSDLDCAFLVFNV